VVAVLLTETLPPVMLFTVTALPAANDTEGVPVILTAAPLAIATAPLMVTAGVLPMLTLDPAARLAVTVPELMATLVPS
jgi:hypothetical protein